MTQRRRADVSYQSPFRYSGLPAAGGRAPLGLSPARTVLMPAIWLYTSTMILLAIVHRSLAARAGAVRHTAVTAKAIIWAYQPGSRGPNVGGIFFFVIKSFILSACETMVAGFLKKQRSNHSFSGLFLSRYTNSSWFGHIPLHR